MLADITAIRARMEATRLWTLVAVAGVIGLVSVFLIVALTRLVFRRLAELRRVATRVVGGDFETPMAVTAEDEIGEFESLFEQFRAIFVDTVHQQTAVEASVAQPPAA